MSGGSAAIADVGGGQTDEEGCTAQQVQEESYGEQPGLLPPPPNAELDELELEPDPTPPAVPPFAPASWLVPVQAEEVAWAAQ